MRTHCAPRLFDGFRVDSEESEHRCEATDETADSNNSTDNCAPSAGHLRILISSSVP